MKNITFHYKKMPESVYKAALYFAFGGEAKDARAFFNKKLSYIKAGPVESPRDGMIGHTASYWDSKYEFTILWVKNPGDVAALAHEINHFVIWLFERRRVFFDADHDEHFTYYVEYLMNQFLDFVDESKPRVKKSGAPAEPWGKRSHRRHRRSQ